MRRIWRVLDVLIVTIVIGMVVLAFAVVLT